MIEYDRQICLRGRPWYQTARRVPLGYELDPAENRGFVLTIPSYLVIEEIIRKRQEIGTSNNEAFSWMLRPEEREAKVI